MPSNVQTTPQKILEATLLCISEKGCANVGLRDIASKAGVVTSQLSYYFQNREGLFSEVLKLLRLRYIEELKSQLVPAYKFNDKLNALIKYNQYVLRSKEPRHRAFLDFFNLAMWNPSFNLQMKKFVDDIHQAIESELNSSADRSTVRSEFPIERLSRLIMATTFGISMQNIINPDSAENFGGFDILQSALIRELT